MDSEFFIHARGRMNQYGITEEQVYETVQNFDDIETGVGNAASINYVKHRMVWGQLSLRVALDPYRRPQIVNTVHPFDPNQTRSRNF